MVPFEMKSQLHPIIRTLPFSDLNFTGRVLSVLLSNMFFLDSAIIRLRIIPNKLDTTYTSF